MNVTESTNLQTLLGWLLDRHTPDDAEPAARAAAVYLADRARAPLGAGPAGAVVEAGWESMLTSCAGCTACAPRRDLDEPAVFISAQVHTDAWGVHTDDQGRGYVLVEVDGEARFLPRSDPHDHESGPDGPVTRLRSPECGSGRHGDCRGGAWLSGMTLYVQCECGCHDGPAVDAVCVPAEAGSLPERRHHGDDAGPGAGEVPHAVVLPLRRVPVAQLRALLARTAGHRIGGAA